MIGQKGRNSMSTKSKISHRMTILLFHFELDIAQESEKGGQDTGSLISITIFF